LKEEDNYTIKLTVKGSNTFFNFRLQQSGLEKAKKERLQEWVEAISKHIDDSKGFLNKLKLKNDFKSFW
jgi:hypothetical protein